MIKNSRAYSIEAFLWKHALSKWNSQQGGQRHILYVLDCNGDISLGGPSLDSYISDCAAGQFLVEWFLVTSACHSVALSVQTIHVACWQHLPSGAAEDWPDADLLPVCWRRRGGEEERRSNWEERVRTRGVMRRGGELLDSSLPRLIYTYTSTWQS